MLAPSKPTLLDVRVTRDPSKMLPGVDPRVLKTARPGAGPMMQVDRHGGTLQCEH